MSAASFVRIAGNLSSCLPFAGEIPRRRAVTECRPSRGRRQAQIRRGSQDPAPPQMQTPQGGLRRRCAPTQITRGAPQRRGRLSLKDPPARLEMCGRYKDPTTWERRAVGNFQPRYGETKICPTKSQSAQDPAAPQTENLRSRHGWRQRRCALPLSGSADIFCR